MRLFVTFFSALLVLSIGAAIFLSANGICGDKESRFECTREWVIAIGPIAGLIAAMIAAYFVYLQIAGMREKNEMARKSQAMQNLNFQSDRLALLHREFPTGAPLRDRIHKIELKGDHDHYWSELRIDRIANTASFGMVSVFLELEGPVVALTAASQYKELCWQNLLEKMKLEFHSDTGGWAIGDGGLEMRKPNEMTDDFKALLEAYASSETAYLQSEADLNAAAKSLAERISQHIVSLQDELRD